MSRVRLPRLKSLLILLLSGGAQSVFTQPPVKTPATPKSKVAKNPIIKSAADPHAAVFGNKVWIYPTHGVPGGPGFTTFSSDDLKTWKRHGTVLSFNDVKWIKDDGAPWHAAWAPGIAKKGDKYYFYFSVGPQHEHPARIGVAVGTSPEGPFVDSGRPILFGNRGFEAIDPMVFHDPKSDKWYFYAGGSAGSTLRIFELNDDMVSFRREIPVKTPPKFTEGAFVHYRNGVYFLTYSHGRFNNNTYAVHYATSDTPYGPWTYGREILSGNERHKGPGHHSVIQGSGFDEWFIVYHRWNDRKGNGPYPGERSVAIDRLIHDGARSIQPVVMTDTVPTPSRWPLKEAP